MTRGRIPQYWAMYSSSSRRNCRLVFVLLVVSLIRADSSAAGQSFTMDSLRHGGTPVPLEISESSIAEVEVIQPSMSDFTIAPDDGSLAFSRENVGRGSLKRPSRGRGEFEGALVESRQVRAARARERTKLIAKTRRRSIVFHNPNLRVHPFLRCADETLVC